jgi:CTP-dependent riboflavin kinase
MELNRLDYTILKLLKKKECVSYFESMTLQEIMSVTNTSRPTTYRKMMDLRKYGYVEKGCKSMNADTFYILDKGINLVENGGVKND